ncbi:type II methionyl aminopeptidase [Candidatus Woesearchaeota archaeon]|nr:type II methionyl aminopeptidase [Candidatus Woesearchaeota archaeon]
MEISEEEIESYRKAGKIAAEALEYGKGLIKSGAKLLDVSEKIEKKIEDLGGKPAFPAQISCDSIAAHYCAEPDDETVFDKQVCSLDIGVHVNGFIGDNACTVDLSGAYSDLVKASEEALKEALKIVQIGVTAGELGKIIQETISSFGFSPIKNLTGHGLSRFNIHDKPTIPNFDTGDETKLEKGMVIAIEPFATDGMGMVYEQEQGNIFSLVQKRPVRSMFAREILKEIEKYNGLPFTTRWLAKKMPLAKVGFGLRELLRAEAVRSYPPLKEKKKGIVTQAEKSLIIGDKIEVITRT